VDDAEDELLELKRIAHNVSSDDEQYLRFSNLWPRADVLVHVYDNAGIDIKPSFVYAIEGGVNGVYAVKLPSPVMDVASSADVEMWVLSGESDVVGGAVIGGLEEDTLRLVFDVAASTTRVQRGGRLYLLK
jgi:hypothetical protein